MKVFEVLSTEGRFDGWSKSVHRHIGVNAGAAHAISTGPGKGEKWAAHLRFRHTQLCSTGLRALHPAPFLCSEASPEDRTASPRAAHHARVGDEAVEDAALALPHPRAVLLALGGAVPADARLQLHRHGLHHLKLALLRSALARQRSPVLPQALVHLPCAESIYDQGC